MLVYCFVRMHCHRSELLCCFQSLGIGYGRIRGGTVDIKDWQALGRTLLWDAFCIEIAQKRNELFSWLTESSNKNMTHVSEISGEEHPIAMNRTFASLVRTMSLYKPDAGRKACVLAPMVRSGELPSRLLSLHYGADLVWSTSPKRLSEHMG